MHKQDATADSNGSLFFSVPGFKNGSIVLTTIVSNRKISFTESISISIWHENDNRSDGREKERRLGGVSLFHGHKKHAVWRRILWLAVFYSTAKWSNCHNCQSGAFNSARSCFLTASLRRVHTLSSSTSCTESLMRLIIPFQETARLLQSGYVFFRSIIRETNLRFIHSE